MSGPPTSSRQRYREYLRTQQSRAATAPDGKASPARPGPQDWTQEPPPGSKRKAGRGVVELAAEFRRVLRGHAAKLAIALATLTLTTVLGLFMPLSTKIAFDYIILDTPGPTGIPPWLGLPTDRIALLWLLGAIMVGVSVVSVLVGMVGRYHMTRLTKLTQIEMRQRVFDHLSQLPLHRLHALKSGGVASIVRDDAGVVGEMLFSVIYNPWRAVLTFAGGLVAMALIDWRMLVGGLAAVPVVWLSHRTWINRIRPVFRATKATRTTTDAHATETFSGIRVVRAFGRRRGEAGRFARGNNLMARQEMLAWWWSRIIEGLWTVIIPGASAVVLVYGGSQVIGGRLTIGDVAAFTAYLLMLLGPLEVLVSTAAGLQNSLAGFDRCLDVLEEPTEFSAALTAAGAAGGPQTAHAPFNPAMARGALTIDNVSFAYPGQARQAAGGAGGDRRVLHEITLDVRAGETIALVGASGSGKTTLCNLVARFFDPTAGRILLDGVDLRSIDIALYRSLLGIVEQEVFLFDGTIGENIGYARRYAGPEAIRAAARSANAEEFIDRLDQGYDTVIGERGVRLSGGQKQRIAIARALLADPRILILDEATSNLDSESEALIQRSLGVLMRGRTCFVIAHRLGTVRNADRIVVLEHGRIAESGTHDQLVARQGRYFEMLQVQLHAGRDYADPAADPAIDRPPSGPIGPSGSGGLSGSGGSGRSGGAAAPPVAAA